MVKPVLDFSDLPLDADRWQSALPSINHAGVEVSKILAPVLPRRLRPVPVDRVAAALLDAALLTRRPACTYVRRKAL